MTYCEAFYIISSICVYSLRARGWGGRGNGTGVRQASLFLGRAASKLRPEHGRYSGCIAFRRGTRMILTHRRRDAQRSVSKSQRADISASALALSSPLPLITAIASRLVRCAQYPSISSAKRIGNVTNIQRETKRKGKQQKK